MPSDFPEYHKIQSLYKRNSDGRFIDAAYSTDILALLTETSVPFRWTEKVDGTNIRIQLFPNGSFKVGGRTNNAQIPATLLQHLYSDLDLTERQREYNVVQDGPIVIYGEGFGGSIQNMGEIYGPEPQFIVYDIWVQDETNRLGGYWLYPNEVKGITNAFDLPTTHCYGIGPINEAEYMVKHADYESALTTDKSLPPEGVVGTPVTQLYDRRGQRVIVKMKGRDYAKANGSRA